MSSRIIAICDICGAEQEIKASLPLDSAQWDRELALEGWWSRPDFDEICPKHPRPATRRSA
jgi:hypothetical protein